MTTIEVSREWLVFVSELQLSPNDSLQLEFLRDASSRRELTVGEQSKLALLDELDKLFAPIRARALALLANDI
jgi:hypothetical protein